MATLLLTVVGGAIGGPIGAAIGALAGQAIDTRLLPSPRREGPRLKDLHVQTSSYGTEIPAVFGTMRVAGTVIWATDLREASQTTGGGKSGGGTTSYTYSTSLAVALSSRPIRQVKRIWAEGNLLRGAGGDFKSPVGAFRVHHGKAGQPVDPLISAALGPGVTPAFREFAYVVIEDMQLSAFGNRIPSLTFEIEADDGAVALSEVTSALARSPVNYAGDAAEPRIGGFAAEGGGVLAALQPLLDAHRVQLADAGDGEATLVRARDRSIRWSREDEVILHDGREGERMQLKRAPLESVPRRLALRYYEPARDFQAGVQSAERPGPGEGTMQLDLAVNLSGVEALQMAETLLNARIQARNELSVGFGWPALAHGVGDVVRIDGLAGRWRIDRVEWADMIPRLLMRGEAVGLDQVGVEADSGAATIASDVTATATRLIVLDLPQLDDQPLSAPEIWALASGESDAWRWANVSRVHPESETSELIGAIGRSAHGLVMNPPGQADPFRLDLRSAIDVELWDHDRSLFPAPDDALLRGRNLCLVGDELMQFAQVEQTAPRRFRLSRLLRGRRGTEWAIPGHASGEVFALLDPAAPMKLALGSSAIGSTLILEASGPGDQVSVAAERLVQGDWLRPLAPVHGRVTVMADGARLVEWIRRSRAGWGWADGGDAPLGEEQESYAASVVDGQGNVLREIVTGSASWLYPPEAFTADSQLAFPAGLRVIVRQLGTFGAGRPLSIPIF